MDAPVTRVTREDEAPRLRIGTFVDDVAQIASGSRKQVMDTTARAAIAFCAGVRSIHLKVSDKTVIVSSDPRISAVVSKVVKRYSNFSMRVAGAARDLGVLNNPQRRRNTSLQSSRLAKGAARFARISPLARTVRAARRLSSTGALPQAVWGASTLGMSPSVLSALVRQVAAATGIQAAGRCASTAIALTMGVAKDPRVASVVNQLQLWIDLWRLDSSARALTVRHWTAMHSYLMGDDAGAAMWSKVAGPWSATVAVMTDLGWNLSSMHQWVDPHGDAWIPNFSGDYSEFLSVVRHSALSKVWRQAADAWCGLGVQGGVDWLASLALHKQLSKLSARATASSAGDTEDAGDDTLLDLLDQQGDVWHDNALTWLELFLTGGFWPAKRFSDACGGPARCTRCTLGVDETALHFLWQCPANDLVDDPRVSDTQDLRQSAVEGSQRYPCFWLRGLLPSALVPVNTPVVDQEHVQYVGSSPEGCWPPGEYYSDASGGDFSAYSAIRRCGVGIAFLDPHYDGYHLEWPNPLLWGAFAPLPGAAQSVPRAELYAILVIIERAAPGAFVIRTDSKVNVQLFQRGKEATFASVNSDLWSRLWAVLDRGEVSCTLIWVKGHADDLDTFIKFNVTTHDLYGNVLADALAGRAAKECQVSLQDSITLKWHYSVVRKVQARAVVLLTLVMQQRAAATLLPKCARPKRISVTGCTLATSHTIALFGRTFHCLKCQSHSPADVDGIKRWLAAPCNPNMSLLRSLTFGTTKPTAVLADVVVHVGRQTLHSSHKLHVYKGLYFCGACGYHASAKAQKLTKQCELISEEGIARVLRLRQGRLPSGLKCWPNESSKTSFIQLEDE